MITNIESIKLALEKLNGQLKEKNIEGSLTYRGEVSHLIRAGRSQVSLNVSEQNDTLFVELFKGKKKIEGSMSIQLENGTEAALEFVEKLYASIDFLPEVPHMRPMGPVAEEGNLSVHKCDDEIVNFEASRVVSFFKDLAHKFSKYSVDVSGAFSAGANAYCVVNTLSTHAHYFLGSDWNIEVVLQLVNDDKKEIRSHKMGETMKEFNEKEIIDELMMFLNIKKETPRLNVEAGPYDVIFSSDALAEMVNYTSWLTFSGESFEYEAGMLKKGLHKIGSKIFGDNVTIVDNPNDPDILYSRQVGLNGVKRDYFPLINEGVIQNLFYSDKDTCDRFNMEVNNDMSVAQIKVMGGDGPSDLMEIVKSTKERTLYIGYIHYMNITNAAKGEFTGSSRFGTLLIEDGQIKGHLYNLRLNDSYFNIFNNIEWFSKELTHVNTATTYGHRMSSSITCPKFTKVHNVQITGTAKISEE
ncbi:TldD/PmbA family protein [Bacteriovorax sp. BSW11_IV]|uniref:metallopeptidase TldD-related protein n=1 Tax=Bacteriovorax sp. BSW11_IV TaxID=1353529 RepID=UPI00038A2B21|nr:metallopeptidase TldD-related protein [Bacteriovorax sp. BSW11_IV]EQC49299.1 TldD/PmbA family protein [Bacteriovorax sp. BSW11_IV]